MYVHDKCGNVFKSVYKMTSCEIAYQFDNSSWFHAMKA